MADKKGRKLDSDDIRKTKLSLAALEGSQIVLSDTFIRVYQGADKRPDVFVKDREEEAKKAKKENESLQKHSVKKAKKENDALQKYSEKKRNNGPPNDAAEKTKTYFTPNDKKVLQNYPKDSSKSYDPRRAVKNYDTSLLFKLLRFTCDLSDDDPLLVKCREVKNIRNDIHNFHTMCIENDADLEGKMQAICILYKETYKQLAYICKEDMSAYIDNIETYMKDLTISPLPAEDWKVYEVFLTTKGKEELIEDKYCHMHLFQPTNDHDMCFPVKEVYTPIMLNEEDTDSDTPTQCHSYPADELLKSSNLWGEGKIILVGEPGSGKTAFNLHLLSLWCDRANDQGGDLEDSIGVLDQISLLFSVDLSLINEDDLTTLISQYFMPKTCLQIPLEKIIQTLLKIRHKVLWVFDGFDEAAPKVRRNLVGEVCRKFERVIVSCRPDFVQTVLSTTKMVKWKVHRLIEMSDASVKVLTAKVLKVLKAPTNAIKDFDMFIEARSKSFISLKSSPLHLTLLCWLWNKADKKTDVNSIATTYSLYNGILLVIKDQLVNKILKIEACQPRTVLSNYVIPWMNTLCSVAFHSFVKGTKKLNAEGIRRLKELCDDNFEVEELIFSTMLHSKKKKKRSFSEDDYVYFLCHNEMLEFLAARHACRNLKANKTVKDVIRHDHDKATNVLTHLAAMVVEDPQIPRRNDNIVSIMKILSSVWHRKKLESETHSRNFNPWYYFVNETKNCPIAIEYLTETCKYYPITDIDLQQFQNVIQDVIPNLIKSEVRVMLFGDTCDCPALNETLTMLKRKQIKVSLDLYKSFTTSTDANAAEHEQVSADDNLIEVMLMKSMCTLVRVTAHLNQDVISNLHSAELEILQLRITHISQLEALKQAMTSLKLKVLTLNIDLPKDEMSTVPLVAQKNSVHTFNLVLNDVKDEDMIWCQRIIFALYKGQYCEIRIKGETSPRNNMTLYRYLKKTGIKFKEYKPPKMVQTKVYSVGGSDDRTDYSLYVGRLKPNTEEDQLHQRIKKFGIEPIKISRLITPLDEYAAAFRVELNNKYECFAIKTELADEAYTAYWYSEENEYLNKEMAANSRGVR